MQVAKTSLARLLRLFSEERALIRQLVWAFAVRAAGAVSALLMNFAIARSLGAAEAGYFLLALATVAFLSPLCRAGLDNVVVRYIGVSAARGRWGEVESVLRQSGRATLLLSVLAAALLWFLAPWIAETLFGKPRSASVLRAIAPALVGLSICHLFSFAFQGIRAVAAAVYAQTVGIALIVIAMSPSMTSSAKAAVIYSAATFATIAVAVYWWRRSHPIVTGTFPRKLLWDSARPLWAVTAAAAMLDWGGQFIAGAYVPIEQIAQLAVAQRSAVVISLLLAALNLSLASRFAALYHDRDLDGLRRVSQMSVKITSVVAVPVAAGIFVCAEPILRLFGPEFAPGALLLRILVAGQVVNAVTGPVGYLLMMTGHEKDYRDISVACGVGAVALTMLLAPVFGVVGVAAATATAIAMQNLIAATYVKRRLGFFTISFRQ